MIDFIVQLTHALKDACKATLQKRLLTKRLGQTLANGRFTILFQPIISTGDQETKGFEALTRFESETSCLPPDEWFKNAQAVGLRSNFERAVINKALQQMNVLPAGTYMSINVTAGILCDGSLAAILSDTPLDRIVIELTEHEFIGDYAPINDALAPLRKAGIRLAVDDAGAGYASFWHVLQLNPDIIKLDGRLITNIHVDRIKRKLVESILSFADSLGMQVVAEGVETVEELGLLADLGVHKAQGYYCGIPRKLSCPELVAS